MTDSITPAFIAGTSDAFSARFFDRQLAERYRDRFSEGRHARVDQSERAALRGLFSLLEPIQSAMDIPCGVGRLSGELKAIAPRIIVADASPIMLEMAREGLGGTGADYLETRCEAIQLPDDSVDLIFCHRFLHHLHEPGERRRVMLEFARVSRRYVVINYYPPGLRSRFKGWLRLLTPGRSRGGRIRSTHGLIQEAGAAGLRFAQDVPIRRFPAHGRFMIFRVS